jgi:hypothetical protein
MSSALPDVFESFATQCGLRVKSEPLISAPRDVLTPIDDMDQHHLVTLMREQSDQVIRLLFITPATGNSYPRLRDVLWWLAADAYAIERSKSKAPSWAATYGYPANAEATLALFRQHLAQATALVHLLGRPSYDDLLSLYEREMSPSRRV